MAAVEKCMMSKMCVYCLKCTKVGREVIIINSAIFYWKGEICILISSVQLVGTTSVYKM